MTISPEYAEELGRQIDELEAENERLRSLIPTEPQAAPDRERIARAICCPSGCSYQGDSEDGEKCYCDTSDFHGSGIEKKTDAVISALMRPEPQEPPVSE